MPFYEKGLVERVCKAFIQWNGWGPPSSEYQVLEFCQAKSGSEAETDEYTDILLGWMREEYRLDTPTWNLLGYLDT